MANARSAFASTRARLKGFVPLAAAAALAYQRIYGDDGIDRRLDEIRRLKDELAQALALLIQTYVVNGTGEAAPVPERYAGVAEFREGGSRARLPDGRQLNALMVRAWELGRGIDALKKRTRKLARAVGAAPEMPLKP